MRLGIFLILALVAPAAGSPGGVPGAVELRYRVSPGEAYAHEVDLRVLIRVLSSKGMPPPPAALKSGMTQWIGGRVTTLVGRRAGMATYEVLQTARLQTKVEGKPVEIPRVTPSVHLVSPRGIRENVGDAGPSSPSSRLGGSGSLVLDPLPDAIVAPGDKWASKLQQQVPGGPKVDLEISSRYVGPRTMDNARCALIDSRATVPPLSFTEDGTSGKVTGSAKLLTFYALDTGMPHRTDGAMHWNITFTGPAGESAQIGVDVTVAAHQVPPTQYEQGLAQRAAQAGAAAVAELLTPKEQVAAAPKTSRPAAPPPARRPATPPPPAIALADPRPAAPVAPPSPPVTLLSPRPGQTVQGECVIAASVAAGMAPGFLVFTVDGERVAAVNGLPFRHRLPKGALTPGAHTIGVEVYGESHVPVARASVRIRVPAE